MGTEGLACLTDLEAYWDNLLWNINKTFWGLTEQLVCGTVKHLGNGDCISLFKVLHHKRNYGQSDVFDVIQLLLAKSCQLTIFN